MLEDVKEIGEDHLQFFSVGNLWHGAVVWEEFDSVGNSISLSEWHVAGVIAIVEESRANVETARASILPAASFHRSVMDNNATTRWCERGTVEVKQSVDLGVGRNRWIDAGGSDKVDNKASFGED